MEVSVAPSLLNEPDQVTSTPLYFKFLGDPNVQGHDTARTTEASTRHPVTDTVVGDEFERVLTVKKLNATHRHRAILDAPITGLVGLDDCLDLLAQSRAEGFGHELELFSRNRGDIVGENDVADVYFLGDDVGECFKPICAACRNSNRVEWQPNSALVGLSD